jgi:hypothetical protein
MTVLVQYNKTIIITRHKTVIVSKYLNISLRMLSHSYSQIQSTCSAIAPSLDTYMLLSPYYLLQWFYSFTLLSFADAGEYNDRERLVQSTSSSLRVVLSWLSSFFFDVSLRDRSKSRSQSEAFLFNVLNSCRLVGALFKLVKWSFALGCTWVVGLRWSMRLSLVWCACKDCRRILYNCLHSSLSVWVIQDGTCSEVVRKLL